MDGAKHQSVSGCQRVLELFKDAAAVVADVVTAPVAMARYQNCALRDKLRNIGHSKTTSTAVSGIATAATQAYFFTLTVVSGITTPESSEKLLHAAVGTTFYFLIQNGIAINMRGGNAESENKPLLFPYTTSRRAKKLADVVIKRARGLSL